MADGDKLGARVEAVERKVDRLAASVDARFDQVDRRFEQVDAALVEQRRYTEFAYERLDAKMDAGFVRLETKMDAGFTRVEERFSQMDGRFARLERKLDQFIDRNTPPGLRSLTSLSLSTHTSQPCSPASKPATANAVVPTSGQVTDQGGRHMRITRTLGLAAASLLALHACSGPEPAREAAKTTPVSSSGMVSSAHPLATEAGLEILAKGGNAFDAAVAVASALNVVEPMMSGAGGYGTIMVYHRETDRARFLNSSDRIPRGVDSDVYRAPTPGWQENRRGAKAVSTPANVRAWEAMSSEYGKLPWADLMGPAIRLAREGFELNEETAFLLRDAFEEFPDHAKSFFGRAGRPLRAGERLIQADLAASLERIAKEGAGVLHGGPLGVAIADEMKARGGFLTLDDLAKAQAEWYEPIGIDYRGVRVLTAPPPANSFPALVRLGMMSRFPPGTLEHNSVEYLHRFAEVTKHAFWTRLRYASDPEVAPVPLDRLLGEAYWQEQVDRIDPAKAIPFEPPGRTGTKSARTVSPPVADALESHTTHFVVADAEGNVVSATQTLGNHFGARIMAPGTGIWLNNSLAYCTFEPAGNPMDAFPGRHKLSGDVPMLLLRDGRVWAALGTPGGHTIAQTVPQMVMNLVDFNMDIQAALSSPRISFVEPDVIIVERDIPESVMNGLKARGHSIRAVRGVGNAHGVAIEYGADGRPVRFFGASDPRGDGLAAGPSRSP